MEDFMRQEITWQSAIGAFLVSSLIALAYPYIILKLGMGPNVSVLAAFLGALFLFMFASKTRGRNALQNNIIQSAATSAASTAFMCVVAAAFGYLEMNESVGAEVHVHIGPWQMFLWLFCSGAIGVFFTALFRRYFIEDPQMVFADGVAAAETISVLDGGTGSGGRMKTLGASAIVGAVIAFFRDGKSLLTPWMFGGRFTIGLEWNVLSIGTGMLVGINVGLSMLLGTLVVYWFGPSIIDHAGVSIVLANVAPQYVDQVRSLITSGAPLTETSTAFLQAHGGLALRYLHGSHYSILMMWAMWPATAMMIASALTAVLLKWRSLATMFRGLSTQRGRATSVQDEDVSLTTIIVMSVMFTVLLGIFQDRNFSVPFWQTTLAVILGLPIILAGVRVLGETNNGPVSLMANSVQALFRLFSPSIGHNLIAAGMSGNINAQGEGLMQVFRTGQRVGSSPRVLTWVQFWAVGIGAAAVAIMYPILTHRYTLGDQLVAPTGLKLSNMAVLLSKGVSAFPPGALEWSIIAAVIGALITLLKDIAKWRWLPSPSGFGFALILPGILNLNIALGAIIGWFWSKVHPEGYDKYSVTVASGLIGGEALVAGLLLPFLFFFGIF